MSRQHKYWGRYALEWIGLIAVLAVTYRFLYVPGRIALQKTRAELNQTRAVVRELQKNDLDKMREEAERLAATEAEYSDIYARLKATREKMPFEPEMGDLTGKIARAADAAGIRISLLQASDEVACGNYQELPLTVEAYGDFANVGRYLEKMETLPRLLTVQSCVVESRPDETNLVKVSLKTKAYRYGGK